MKLKLPRGSFVFSVAICCITALAPAAPLVSAQSRDGAPPTAVATDHPDTGPVDLDWVPPALAPLRVQATSRSSFTLDRTMLAAAAGLMPDSDAETRQAIAKVDGVSVHLLRFGPDGIPDEASVGAIRQAYHLRGWKHLITNVSTPDAPPRSPAKSKDPLHNGNTDLWLVIDGMNVRGAVALVETPRSLTLITMAGNLSPADILHLRGHFGIPRFDGDSFKNAKDR